VCTERCRCNECKNFLESVHLVKAISKLKEETNSDSAACLDNFEQEGPELAPAGRIGAMYDGLIAEVDVALSLNLTNKCRF
jgi:hypothetical protein